MKLQRTIICITGVFFAVGFAASQAGAGPGRPGCSSGEIDMVIEVNALRGRAPTVSVGETRPITAKARIVKGTAESGTTIDTTLTIEAVDGGTVIDSKTSGSIRLGVGQGGKGATLPMSISQCNSGAIDFVATFSGRDEDGDVCTATGRLTKTCN